MNLRWIMLFATIAEEKSFTRAANRLNIAQPWLSAQMRRLENQLGVQLLIRQSLGVTVTPEGEALLPYARQLSEAAEMFRQTARTLGETHSKSIRIGSHLPMIDIAPLRSVSRDFARAHKSFTLSVEVSGTPDLLDRLRAAEFDFIVALAPLPEVQEHLEQIPLGSTDFCLLSPAKARAGVAGLLGHSVGVPPADWHPEMIARLIAYLKQAGASEREVPEFDRRALEHLVATHQSIVATLIDAEDRAPNDPGVKIAPIPGLSGTHTLCRIAGRTMGRASEHYWAAVQSRSI